MRRESNAHRTRFVVLVLIAVAFGIEPALASMQVVISQAVPDSNAGTITIGGENFGSGTPSVTLGTQPLTVQSSNATEIVAALPTLAAGTYLLTVSTGPGANHNDSMAVAIGSGAAPPNDPTIARRNEPNTFSFIQQMDSGLVVNNTIPNTNNTIHAQSSASDAFVINALSLATSGQPRGINSTTFSPGSAAVVGSAQPAVGGTGGAFDSYGEGGNGVWTAGNGVNAVGLYALALATTGNGRAIHAEAYSPGGVAGMFINVPGGRILSGQANNQEVFWVEGNGDVYGANFISTSSARYKTNVADLEGALDAVSSLRGVSFDWKESGEHDIGLIAEEVAETVPEVVAFDAEGARGVDYARLTALLVEAVKEQQKQIDDLRRQLQEKRE